MTKEQIGGLGEAWGRWIDPWYKLIRFVILIGGVIAGLWVQFIGEGIQKGLQGFLGITELTIRLDELERNVPPPPVVEWNEAMAQQRGLCTYQRCVYTLNGARTRYGESCGRPVVTPFLRRSNGQSQQIKFDEREQSAVELTSDPLDFDVFLRIPSYRPEGDYSWAAKLVYPSCPGRGEPVPRWTPWFPLRVTKP